MPSLRQIRLATGLILFVYVTLHFANHALGNISVGAMESGLAIQKLIWQSLPGAVILYVSLLTHMSLGFWALYARRRFRWTRLEATQLVLGLSIPFLLTNHVIGTRVALSQFGIEKGYAQELVGFWVNSPLLGAVQAVLLLIVWIHGCLGIALLAEAQAVLSAREGTHAFDRGASASARAARLLSGWRTDAARGSGPGLAGAQSVVRPRRNAGSECGPGRRAHADACLPGRGAGRHALRPGLPTMERAPRRLDPADLSRPHDSRRARLQRAGGEPHQQPSRMRMCAAAAAAARRAASASLATSRACRLRAPPSRRCSSGCMRPQGSGSPVSFVRPATSQLVPMLSPYATTVDAYRTGAASSGMERYVVIMFVDMRGSSRLAERRLPFDTVFIINQFLNAVSSAVLERRRRTQPGAGRRASGVVRHERPARRRLPAGDRRQRRNRQPGSRASIARCLMRWSSRSASASASTPA